MLPSGKDVNDTMTMRQTLRDMQMSCDDCVNKLLSEILITHINICDIVRSMRVLTNDDFDKYMVKVTTIYNAMSVACKLVKFISLKSGMSLKMELCDHSKYNRVLQPSFLQGLVLNDLSVIGIATSAKSHIIKLDQEARDIWDAMVRTFITGNIYFPVYVINRNDTFYIVGEFRDVKSYKLGCIYGILHHSTDDYNVYKVVYPVQKVGTLFKL